eukprot:scaffold6962_cov54-Phaeocystis_antarctica.AAC.4
MKLSMLLIPVLFLAISVDALATPSPSPAPPSCEDEDPGWCQSEVGTDSQKLEKCKGSDAGSAVDMRCRLSCG